MCELSLPQISLCEMTYASTELVCVSPINLHEAIRRGDIFLTGQGNMPSVSWR
jgi:hypothetical protein